MKILISKRMNKFFLVKFLLEFVHKSNNFNWDLLSFIIFFTLFSSSLEIHTSRWRRQVDIFLPWWRRLNSILRAEILHLDNSRGRNTGKGPLTDLVPDPGLSVQHFSGCHRGIGWQRSLRTSAGEIVQPGLVFWESSTPLNKENFDLKKVKCSYGYIVCILAWAKRKNYFLRFIFISWDLSLFLEIYCRFLTSWIQNLNLSNLNILLKTFSTKNKKRKKIKIITCLCWNSVILDLLLSSESRSPGWETGQQHTLAPRTSRHTSQPRIRMKATTRRTITVTSTIRVNCSTDFSFIPSKSIPILFNKNRTRPFLSGFSSPSGPRM